MRLQRMCGNAYKAGLKVNFNFRGRLRRLGLTNTEVQGAKTRDLVLEKTYKTGESVCLS